MTNWSYNNEVRIYESYSNDNYQLVIGWCLFDSSIHPPKGFVSSLMHDSCSWPFAVLLRIFPKKTCSSGSKFWWIVVISLNDFWFYDLNSLWTVDAMKCWLSWRDLFLVCAVVLPVRRVYYESFSSSFCTSPHDSCPEMRVIINYVSVIHQQRKLRSNALFVVQTAFHITELKWKKKKRVWTAASFCFATLVFSAWCSFGYVFRLFGSSV